MLGCYGCHELPQHPWAEIEISPTQNGAVLCEKCIASAPHREALAGMFASGTFGSRARLTWLEKTAQGVREHTADPTSADKIQAFREYR